MTNEELCSRIQNNDCPDVAFLELCQKNIHMVHRIIGYLRLVRGYSRDELEQEGILALWRAAKRYKHGLSVMYSTYAWTAVMNSLLGLMRCRNKKPGECCLDQDIEDWRDQERILDEEMQRQAIVRILPLLNQTSFLVVLSRMDGRSFRQIGKQMGISGQRVRVRYLKAVQEIRDILGLEEEEETCSVG